jgi:hypothetical protein
MSERDCDREPFIRETFFALLTDFIDDDHSRNLHNAALAGARLVDRILLAGDKWYEKFNQLIGEEAYSSWTSQSRMLMNKHPYRFVNPTCTCSMVSINALPEFLSNFVN